MQTADTPRVAEIIVFGWRSAFRHILSDEILFNELSVTKTMKRLEKQLTESIDEKFVFDDGIVKACFTAADYASEETPNALQVLEVYVDPFFQRQNIGEKMMKHSEELANKKGFNKIIAVTYAENKISRPFYEKLGFVSDGNESFSEKWGATVVRYVKTL